MSLPIYAYSFLWPMSDVGQLLVFFVTNIWTFLLREFDLILLLSLGSGAVLIRCFADDNRDQFHTVHHKSIELNFGQYSALWDRLGGTYADPDVFFKPARERREKAKNPEY